MQPTQYRGPRLPAQRAFVVQFAAETSVGQGCFVGRVEHVVSGQAQRFHTLDELLVFLAGMLTTLDTEGIATAADSCPPPCNSPRNDQRK